MTNIVLDVNMNWYCLLKMQMYFLKVVGKGLCKSKGDKCLNIIIFHGFTFRRT